MEPTEVEIAIKPEYATTIVEKPFKRYSREDLVDLMDGELSILAPRLKPSMLMLLSNSSSNNFLADTISREDSSNDCLIQKASSTGTFESSMRESISGGSVLPKSYSFTPSLHNDASGDGWNQVGTGEKAMRTFRSCLNKLTADNFEAVLAEVKKMRVGDDATILSFIELLYGKAIMEPTYATYYVMLTMALKNIFTVGKKSFEHSAIVACQRGFEDAMEKLQKLNQMSDDAKDKLRRGLSGSIQFIAKMYLNRILTRRIIMEICGKLLNLECSESIEPLCKLLEIAGGTLEKDLPNDEKLNLAMRKLGSIASKFPTRIKFMIQNLMDQRRDHWKPRTSKEAPKKLDQVAEECGFVKRMGAVGRYDEVEPEIPYQRPANRNDDFSGRGNRGENVNRGNRGGNRGRSFRGGHRRGGKPFGRN